ncbi:unnamed protein product, partial [Owenia fusiformis]
MELADQAPSFQRILQDVQAFEGASARFRCKAQGQPRPTATWYKDGVQLEAGEKYAISSHEGTLTLYVHDLTGHDAGQYTCQISNDLGSCSTTGDLIVQGAGAMRRKRESEDHWEKSKIKLQKYDVPDLPFEYTGTAPVFNLPLMGQTVKAGRNTEFTVCVTCTPEAELTWFHNGSKIEVNDKYGLEDVSGVHTLYIKGTSAEDAGEYSCLGQNSYGQATTSGVLTIIEEVADHHIHPEFSTRLHRMHISEGQEARFECHISGEPTPVVHWYKDRKLIHDGHHYNISFDADTQCHLLVIEEAMYEDNGWFMCRASNEAGTESSEARLTVDFPGSEWTERFYSRRCSDTTSQSSLDRISFSNHSRSQFHYATCPTFTTKLRSKRVEVGMSVTLSCSATGTPMPSIRWFKDGEMITTGGRFIVKNKYGLLSLEISPVKKVDTGHYTVTAHNSEGEATCTAEIDVDDSKVVDECDYERPEFLSRIRHTIADEGTRAVFECQVIGHPMPDFTWQRDTFELFPDENLQMTSNPRGYAKLVVRECASTDAGMYSCIAHSIAGRTKCSASLRVLEKSGYTGKGMVMKGNRESLSFSRRPLDSSYSSHSYSNRSHESTPERNDTTARTHRSTESSPEHMDVTRPLREIQHSNLSHQNYEMKSESQKPTAPMFAQMLPETFEAKEGENVMLSVRIHGDPLPSGNAYNQWLTFPSQSSPGSSIRNPLPRQVYAIEGQALLLSVRVLGGPYHKVTWHKGARDLQFSSRHRIFHEGDTHRLQIDECLVTDAGQYTAMATGPDGDQQETTAHVHITAHPAHSQDEILYVPHLNGDTGDHDHVHQHSLDHQSPTFVTELPKNVQI